MSCDHDVGAESLYPSDADVLDIAGSDGEISVTFAAPCPDCGTGLALAATVDTIEDEDFDLPLDDERYD